MCKLDLLQNESMQFPFSSSPLSWLVEILVTNTNEYMK